MKILFRLFALKVLPVLYALEHVLWLILLWTAIIIAVLLLVDWLVQRNKKAVKPMPKKVEAPARLIVKPQEPVTPKEAIPEAAIEKPVLPPVVKEEVIGEAPVVIEQPVVPGIIEEKPEPVNWFSLQDDVNLLAIDFRKSCEEKNISFALELDDRLPLKINANKQWLNELIEELFSVALMQTSSGSISLKIKMVKANDKTGAAQFLVTDTGAGLPPALLKAVQEKDELFQFEDALLQSVLVKLRDVKKNVEENKGRLTVATRAGQGSTIGALVEFGV